MPPIVIDHLRGRNGFDPPLRIPDDQAAEMLNVDLYEGQLGRKRNGTSSLSLTFSAGGPFTGRIVAAIRHVPGASEAAQELWLIDDAATPIIGRLAAGTTFVAVSPAQAIAARPQDVMGVSFNGKLFFAGWDGSANRAMVWDGTSLRFVGLAAPAAPTGADMGAGALTLSRSYKVAGSVQSGGVTLRRSELGAVLTRSITAKAGSTITKPSFSEGETHWELYASDTATGTYYLIATTAVGTATYDDTAASIPTTTAAPVVGTNTPPPSARFVATDGNRVLWYSGIESSAGSAAEPKNSRVWFSAAIGASATSIGDDERVPIQSVANGLRYYIDVGENDGGEPRALMGPLYGAFYAFQSHAYTELSSTGKEGKPFRRYQHAGIGAVNQKSCVMAPDASGNMCIYFLNPKDGPRRIGNGGLEWLGADVKDRWDLVNLDASTVVAHGVYHADRNQIWWWIATGSSTVPDDLMIFDISEGIASVAEGVPAIRKGFTRFSGDLVAANCSVMFSQTPGATMVRRLKPYVGTTTANTVLKCDTGTATVQGTITSKPYAVGDLTHHGEVQGGSLVADAASGVPIQVSVVKDYGKEQRDAVVTLTAEGTETSVVKPLSGDAIGLAECKVVHFVIGDAASIANGWTMDALTIQVDRQEVFAA